MMKRANLGINPVDLVDRISTLPDSILSLILSCIPTVNAVATSVLSKRWKSLWKGVHNLDFGRYGYYKGCHKEWSADEDMKFARFVNHVMFFHDGGFLNKFSLVWKPICIPSLVISWISTAITRNLHELYLCVDQSHVPFEIPSGVFGCETLRSLVLDGNMLVSDSVVVCLPKLERLTLVSVYFHTDVAFQKLISGCPVLNILYVQMDIENLTEYNLNTETNLFTFIISSTSLRHFLLEVESDSVFLDEVSDCSLELEAPSLVYLRLVGCVPKIFVRGSLSSLVEAQISLTLTEYELSDANICNSLVEAIRAFKCAKSLTLSEYVLSALSRAAIGLSTKFERLTELLTWANSCYCSSIQDFIQSSDSLEVLIVNKDSLCLPHENDGYIQMHSNWTTPVEIPRCLSNSLKTVEFDGYRGFDFGRDMIRYILKHGSALELMTIHCYIRRDGVKLELVDEIRDFPRKSRSCRVDFFSDMEDISFGLQG